MIIILLVVLALVIFHVLVVRERTNIEDCYLKNKTAHSRSWIICRVTYDPKSLETVLSTLRERCKQLNDWFRGIYGHNLKCSVVRSVAPGTFPSNDHHLCFYADTRNNYLHVAFDHNVIGGETITRMGSIMVGSDRLIKLPECNALAGLCYVPYFLYKKPHKGTSCVRHGVPDTMRIFNWRFTTPRKGSRYEILYKILMKLYKTVGKNRDHIMVYLPVAFINTSRHNYNNVGLVWLKFSPDVCRSVSELKSCVSRKNYEALVSNTALNLGLVPPNSSKSVRGCVDAVISMTYGINALGRRLVWSYYDKPDYPLYVAVGTDKQMDSDTLDTSVMITVNTDKFKPSKNMRELKIVDNIITDL